VVDGPGDDTEPDPTPVRFSDELEDWLKSPGPKTIGGLGEKFAEKGFAVILLLLMILPATPLPTGGITHALEIIAMVVALQMVLGRRDLWLPNRWRTRELGSKFTGKAAPFIIRRIRTFERISRPRGKKLLETTVALQACGLAIGGLAVAAFLAPPFSGLDTLPSLGAVVIALAIILDDLALAGIGLGIGVGGVALIMTIGAALVRFITGLF
jgi:hypothetical protein